MNNHDDRESDLEQPIRSKRQGESGMTYVRESPISQNARACDDWSKTWRIIMHRKSGGRAFDRKRSETKGKSTSQQGHSFHRRNFRLFAAPVLFLFVLIRSVATNVWALLAVVISHNLFTSQRNRFRSRQGDAEAPNVMLSNNKSLASKVGPGEPALVKQKHHHRKAFEYISKALKIDEEDAGKCQ